MSEGGVPGPVDPAEVDKFEQAAQEFADRENLDIDDAREKLAELLTNLVEHPLEIFALRIGLEDLEARVTALESTEHSHGNREHG
jgi:hypothetical protein